MDVRNASHRVAVEVRVLDLWNLSPGQAVELLTSKGTVWIVRTNASVFNHESNMMEHTAVWGEGVPARNPMAISVTRELVRGEGFSVTDSVAADFTTTEFSTIEHILVQVKPES